MKTWDDSSRSYEIVTPFRPGYFPFHSPLRASFQVRSRGAKKKPRFEVSREGTPQVPIQCVTLASYLFYSQYKTGKHGRWQAYA